MRDEILRHQLLLTRLVRTQAKTSQQYIKKAEKIIIKALENQEFTGLADKVMAALGPLPRESMRLAQELAQYEAEFTSKLIKKNIGKEVEYSNKSLAQHIRNTKVAVALNKPKHTLEETYTVFRDTKARQLLRLVSDSRIMKEEVGVTLSKLSNLVSGLYATQGISLATVAVTGSANIARSFIAKRAKMLVQWSIDLELNNCPDCEERDGEIYEPGEVDGDIPMHARCGCTLIPVEGDNE